MRPTRLAILATHPIQYQCPIWRALAEDPELCVEVIFGCNAGQGRYRDEEFGRDITWDVPLTSGFPHTFLHIDASGRPVTPTYPTARGLHRHLKSFSPDVALLNAYGGLFWLQATALLRVRGVPLLLRHEASDTAQQRTSLKGIIRDTLLRQFYRQISGFAVIGSRARDHVERLAPANVVRVASPYCVDANFFERAAAALSPQRTALRTELGIAPDQCAFIFSGKLIPKKDPLLILTALALLPPALRDRIHLIVLGDGELSDAVARAGRDLLGPRFHFPGFVNQSEISRWFVAADCLVLPSRLGAGETWGLVVNEAFHFGLPALVSTGVGCHPDLITENVTGRTFPSGDVGAFACLLAKFAEELPGAREHYRRNTRTCIAGFNVRSAAAGIKRLARDLGDPSKLLSTL
jgi:glycosyltransferase involved in cell wall biosynthesis